MTDEEVTPSWEDITGNNQPSRAPKSHRGGKRAHRASYPTPGFYLFTLLLNLLGTILSGGLLYLERTPDISLLIVTGLAVLGVFISIYVTALKPRESNKKLRKVLVGIMAGYGLAIAAVVGVLILANPNLFL